MNAFPAAFAAAEDEHIALVSGPLPHELRFLREADAGNVHDDVAELSLVEHDAARDGRDTHPLPVLPDPRDDAAEQVLRMPRTLRQAFRRGVEGPALRPVRQGDGLGAPPED